MSAVGDALAAAQAQNRQVAGSPVTVGGVSTWAITKSEGATPDFLNDGPVASVDADKRVFNVTPSDFTTPPKRKAAIIWRGVTYLALRVAPEEYGDTTISYRLFAVQDIIGGSVTDSADALFPAEVVHLWAPQTLPQRTNGTTLKAIDGQYQDASTLVAYFEPLTDDQKMMAGGQLDARMSSLYTKSPVKLNAVIVQADGSAWIVDGSSELLPIIGYQRARVKHLSAPPPGVGF